VHACVHQRVDKHAREHRTVGARRVELIVHVLEVVGVRVAVAEGLAATGELTGLALLETDRDLYIFYG